MLINVTYYDPKNTIFKSMDKREHVTRYECDCPEKCEAYIEGRCLLSNIGLFNHRVCPHGFTRQVDGYTTAARNFGKLIHQYKTDYNDLLWKLKEINHVQKIYDYWFLNLPWLDCEHHKSWKYDATEEKKLYESSMTDYFKEKVVYKDLIKDEDFTVEFLTRLLDFRPCTIMNDSLYKTFREKYLPKFFYDLRKYYPDKYKEIQAIRPEVDDYSNKVTFKGKYAKVTTLKPGNVKVGTNTIVWNGKTLDATTDMLFYGKLGNVPLTITPDENSVVEILDDSTVDDNTIFE